MDVSLLVDWIFLLVASGTALFAGYLAIGNGNHAKALQTGAISILWFSIVLIDGYYNTLVSMIAIGTLALVWILTQNRKAVHRS